MDPIKVIFQYKNANRKVHHNIYVFIGKVKKDVFDVLE
jgi:hypothetical protein